jgi:lipopolysaccharide/colanic/teichoic acid biosynthesis glycosyltransferase
VRRTERMGVTVRTYPPSDVFASTHGSASQDAFVFRSMREGLGTRLWAKRAMDMILASFLLALTLPVLLLAMLAIVLTSPGPAVFRQRRVGYRRQEFVIYKLRTMSAGSAHAPESEPKAEAPENAVEEAGFPPPRQPSPGPASQRVFEKIRVGDGRVTPVGRILRKLSIDELPQLLNVLRGDMSLVGPRPLLMSDMRHFPSGRPMRRFDMKPGLTGLWQVSGRSLLSDEERIRLDVEYVERWSPWLDLRIILQTPMVVLLAKGAV